MIPRSEQRIIDERTEARYPATSSTAVMEFRGRKHVVLAFYALDWTPT